MRRPTSTNEKSNAAAIPNAQFEIIPNAGHMTTMENPAAVNEALLRFVKKLNRKSEAAR